MEIEFDKIIEMWKMNKYESMLYIHSPFCKTKCTYCVYQGIDNYSEEDLKYFYLNYLPAQLDKYKPIIDNKFKYVYFGGGTPNLNLSFLKKINDKISELKLNLKEKIIEIHPSEEISKEDINLLKTYGFTTVILGIQSFNNFSLKRWNRQNNYNPKKIERLILDLKKLNIRVGLDFLLENKSKIDILFEDISIINKFKIKPDEVTIAPMYQNYSEEFINSFFDLSKKSPVFKEFKKDFIYECELNHHRDFCKVCRFFNKNISKNIIFNNFYGFIPFLEEGNSPYLTSVLGIGSYKNPFKNVYSVINRKYFYCEINDNLHKAPKYKLTKWKSFFDKIKDTIDIIEKDATAKGINFPVNSYVKIYNYEVPINKNFKNYSEKNSLLLTEIGLADYTDSIKEEKWH